MLALTPPPDRAIPVLWQNFIRTFNVPGRLDTVPSAHSRSLASVRFLPQTRSPLRVVAKCGHPHRGSNRALATGTGVGFRRLYPLGHGGDISTRPRRGTISQEAAGGQTLLGCSGIPFLMRGNLTSANLSLSVHSASCLSAEGFSSGKCTHYAGVHFAGNGARGYQPVPADSVAISGSPLTQRLSVGPAEFLGAHFLVRNSLWSPLSSTLVSENRSRTTEAKTPHLCVGPSRILRARLGTRLGFREGRLSLLTLPWLRPCLPPPPPPTVTVS